MSAVATGEGRREFDVHESVHLNTTIKITNKMHYIDLIYCSKSALHVSGGSRPSLGAFDCIYIRQQLG